MRQDCSVKQLRPRRTVSTCLRNLAFTLQVAMEAVGGKGRALKVSEQRSDIIRVVLLGKWIGKLEVENRLVKACAQARN